MGLSVTICGTFKKLSAHSRAQATLLIMPRCYYFPAGLSVLVIDLKGRMNKPCYVSTSTIYTQQCWRGSLYVPFKINPICLLDPSVLIERYKK